jgi:hypothetical protein
MGLCNLDSDKLISRPRRANYEARLEAQLGTRAESMIKFPSA